MDGCRNPKECVPSYADKGKRWTTVQFFVPGEKKQTCELATLMMMMITDLGGKNTSSDTPEALLLPSSSPPPGLCTHTHTHTKKKKIKKERPVKEHMKHDGLTHTRR